MSKTCFFVIYHGKCADGFSAAWVFWHVYGLAADFHAASYGEPPPDVTGRRVYLVDFSFTRDTLLELARQAEQIIILDHHQTADQDLADIPRFETDPHSLATVSNAFELAARKGLPPVAACIDLQRSGCTIAWDYVFPCSSRPPLLGHIEDRDLWRFKLPHTREIQAAVFSHEYSFETWDRLMMGGQVELLQLTAAGAAIERKHQKDLRELISTCTRTMEIAGYQVPVASLPHTMASDAGHLMSEGAPFAACYWDTPELRQFSLRSRPEGADVAAIAEQYGGGGHKHAAGFRVPRNHPLAQS